MSKIMWACGFFPFLFFFAGCAGPSRVTTQALEPPTRGIYHEVQKGETLWGIGRSYNVSPDQIVSVNKLSDPSHISPGQLLFIPASPMRVEGKVPSGTPHFSWPVQGKVVSYFGGKTLLGKNRGIDLSGAEGNPVLAAAPGRVSFVGEKVKGFGKTIILEHDRQFQTVYAHNQELLVKPGEVVQQRQPIARVGRTGRVQQPSLHFEIRYRNRPLNPMEYLVR